MSGKLQNISISSNFNKPVQCIISFVPICTLRLLKLPKDTHNNNDKWLTDAIGHG